MKALVLLNAAAGTIASAANGAGDQPIRRLEQSLAQNRIDAEIHSCGAAEIAAAAREAAGRAEIDAIFVGGGDGTLSTVANTIAGTGKALGALPLGTHNHFAKDVGIPLDLDAAIDALASAEARDLPVGEVNGTIFINFSAIGLHPVVVKHRDAQSRARGRGKWVAFFVALLRVLRRPPVLRLTIRTNDGQALRRLATSVIVCNNEHQMRAFGVQRAAIPGRNVLNVFVAGKTGAIGILWMFARAMLGRLDDSARNFESLHVESLDIHLRRRTVRVSIDGEVTDLRPPLKYRVRPTGLKVLMPRAPV